MRIGFLIGSALVFILSSCDSSHGEREEALFTARACGHEIFHVLMRDPETIAHAKDLIGDTRRSVLIGKILRGGGGFNDPWSWHLDPDDVRFADLAAEVCDGCPSFVEQNLDYWVDTVGTYCPWSTEILARER